MEYLACVYLFMYLFLSYPYQLNREVYELSFLILFFLRKFKNIYGSLILSTMLSLIADLYEFNHIWQLLFF